MADINVKEIQNFIKDSVKALTQGTATNCRLKLDDRLAVFVGWSEGFGEEDRDDVIQATDDKDYGICAGIKVWTSDDVWTDFDYLNFPFTEEEAYDLSTSISKADVKDNFERVAQFLVDCYEEVEDFEIEENGEIISKVDIEESCKGKKDLKEYWKADDVLADLADRAFSIYKDAKGYGDEDVEEAVSQAMDEGLIYDEDIFNLAANYLRGSDILDLFYEYAWEDVYERLDEMIEDEAFDEEEDEEEDVEEGIGESCKDKKDLKEYKDMGNDLSEYQKWVDYDMERYHRISDKTMGKLKSVGLSVVKDQYGDYEVIADRKIKK